jgi:hypothetical protein
VQPLPAPANLFVLDCRLDGEAYACTSSCPAAASTRRAGSGARVKGRYLFNAFALACVFRAKLLRALSEAGLSIPVGLPRKWVVDCRDVGSGEPALEYLSRYLYRGVIREQDLVDYDATAGTVTFRYRDGQTQKTASSSFVRTFGADSCAYSVLC